MSDKNPDGVVVHCHMCGEQSPDLAGVLELAERWMLEHTRVRHPDDIERVKRSITRGPRVEYACGICGWQGPRERREVNYCAEHQRWSCARCFFAGRC